MKAFLKTKTATILLSAVLVMILFITVRLLTVKYQIDKQISDLQARADRVKGENQQLSDLVKYLNTTQYQEKEARDKLNLKKEGEFVVGLPKDQSESEDITVEPARSNPKKWFDYFFNPHTG